MGAGHDPTQRPRAVNRSLRSPRCPSRWLRSQPPSPRKTPLRQARRRWRRLRRRVRSCRAGGAPRRFRRTRAADRDVGTRPHIAWGTADRRRLAGAAFGTSASLRAARRSHRRRQRRSPAAAPGSGGCRSAARSERPDGRARADLSSNGQSRASARASARCPAALDCARRRSGGLGPRDLAVAVRSAWRAVRSNAASVVGGTSADRYDRAIGGVDDAIGTRNAHRTTLALRNADRDLAAIENSYDHQEAPWRRFIRSHFGV